MLPQQSVPVTDRHIRVRLGDIVGQSERHSERQRPGECGRDRNEGMSMCERERERMKRNRSQVHVNEYTQMITKREGHRFVPEPWTRIG